MTFARAALISAGVGRSAHAFGLVSSVCALLAFGGTALAQPGTPVHLFVPDGDASDHFGISVAISGDTLVVGTFGDDVGANVLQGSAHVYRRTGSAWTHEAVLTAFDGAPGDRFGFRVGISGDTVVVGSVMDNVGAVSNQGSVYAFVRTGTAWGFQAKLTAADGAQSDGFGAAVAISGDTAVVGANFADVGANTDQGAAYVFVRSGAVWTEQAKLTAADGAASDRFATDIAIDGDTVVAGAHLHDEGINTTEGAAYVFVRSGAIWTQQARLTASDHALNDQFGRSVALDGDTLVVGATDDDLGANTNQGSAYIFTRSGALWTPQARLSAPDGAPGDLFGISSAISGDTVVVGSFHDDVGASGDQGSVYVFVRSGGAWAQVVRLIAPDGAPTDQLGIDAAISGGTVVAGSWLDDLASNDQGSVWVFDRSGCLCLADYNCDGFVDGIDSDQFNNAFEAGEPVADITGDGFVDGIDSDTFNNAFEAGC